MSCLLVVNGGLGKNIMALNWMEALRETYDGVYVISYYTEVYRACPFVNKVYTPGSSSIKELIEDEDCVLLTHDPYDEPSFIRKKVHLFEAMRQAWKIPENCKTSFHLDLENVPFLIDEYNANCPHGLDNFFLIQFTGGQSNIDSNSDYNPAYENVKRNYPYASKLVSMLKEEYPDSRVISYSLPSEPIPSGVEKYSLAFWHYRILATHARAIICIDSSLNHLTYQIPVPKVVLWGETAPEQFGYEDKKIINLREYRGYTPPHFRPLGSNIFDVPFSKPSTVLEALRSLHI